MYTDLIKQIASVKGKIKVYRLIEILAEEDIDLAWLIDLTFHSDNNLSFKAAWLLENMYLKYPESFVPHISYILSRLKEVKNPSCKRHYAKILMYITSPKAPKAIKEKLKDSDLEPAIEQCFDWLIDPEVLVAVKAFASEALFNMRRSHPWITEELTRQLEFMMRNGSTAIQTKGKHLLSALNR
jgi:hypothetical protein